MKNRVLKFLIIISIIFPQTVQAENLKETYKNSQEYCTIHWDEYHDPTAANGFNARWTCTEDYISKYAPHLLNKYKTIWKECYAKTCHADFRFCFEEAINNDTQNSLTDVTPATKIYNINVNSMVYVKTQLKVGSGVIVQEDGTFITCFHVIENADYINIKTYDSRTFKVNGFKYINPTEDIAILTIDTPYSKFTPIDINYNQLQIGEKVYTIANPKGLEFSFSDGLLSQYTNEYIQFTAPVSPGSSGGALLNEKGQLIGIITSLLKEAQNINFALPNDYYVSKINNLPIKNTYNQNWTKFLLSQTNNSQFKINTDYRNIEKENFETYYNRVKYYANLPDYPPHLYAVAGYLAFYAYFETLKQDILNDAIKWYELSIIHNTNVEVSLYALSMLYAMGNNITKFEKCLTTLTDLYPESGQVLISALKMKAAGTNIYITHFEKLSQKAFEATKRERSSYE